MASNGEEEEAPPRGNEWEVVSLASSAYAALNNESRSFTEYERETSEAMFMSGHFVFPPSQHENLPLETENISETQTEQSVENVEFLSEEVTVKQLGSSGFHGIQIFDDYGNILPICDAYMEEDSAAHEVDLEDNESVFHSTALPSSSHSNENKDGSNIVEESSSRNCRSEPSQQESNTNEHDNEIPCQAWWKRKTASLVSHAKEANTFWSVFVAAAVMGLVILGQHWQQERWQILQMKLHRGLHDERIVRMFGPLSRIKDIFVGGHNRGTFIKDSVSSVRH